MVKIHIIGPVGSGKSSLAKELSNKFNIPLVEPDNVVRERKPTGDVRRSNEEIVNLIAATTKKNGWISEGVHTHGWIAPLLTEADLIIYYEPSTYVRLYRINKRFVKQCLKIEPSNYKPTFRMLKSMYTWTNLHNKRWKGEIEDILEPFQQKVIHLQTKKQFQEFLIGTEQLYS